MSYNEMKNDKILLREKLNKLPEKVQRYIQEEHEKKVECDNVLGIANSVIEYNMYNEIRTEYTYSISYYKNIDGMNRNYHSLKIAEEELEEYKRRKKKSVIIIRSKENRINKFKSRYEKYRDYVSELEHRQDLRHEKRMLAISGKMERRMNSDLYKNYENLNTRNNERAIRRDEYLKSSTLAKHTQMDANYATFAQYDYMMKDGEHYIVMNRERKYNPTNDVKDMSRPITMKLAELIVNLSALKSEEYNWCRWPNVYEARDMHLVGLNSYILRHTDDVDTGVLTMEEYEHNKQFIARIKSLKNDILNTCRSLGMNPPKSSTINNYPCVIQRMYSDRESLMRSRKSDPVTMVIMSPELVSVCRLMLLENGGD